MGEVIVSAIVRVCRVLTEDFTFAEEDDAPEWSWRRGLRVDAWEENAYDKNRTAFRVEVW